MPHKPSNPQKRSRSKSKATARQRASEHRTGQRNSEARQRVPASAKEISQSRYPGETPLTGEDRPSRRPGGKVQGSPSARPERGGTQRQARRGAR